MRFLLFLAPLAALGGWATITVEDLPEHLVSEQPATLTFTVRQHGVHLLDDLKPTLEATTAGGAVVRSAAAPAGESGRYVAIFTLPSPGDWTIKIESGFGTSRSTLEPITAIAPRSKLCCSCAIVRTPLWMCGMPRGALCAGAGALSRRSSA